MASVMCVLFVFFFSSRRRHTRLQGDWSSDVCSSDLGQEGRPYWATTNRGPELIGQPENPPPIPADFFIGVKGETLFFAGEPVQAGTESGNFEARRPLKIVAPVSLRFEKQVALFTPGSTRDVSVEVTAARASTKGELSLDAPTGWKIIPAKQPFHLALTGQREKFSFKVTAPSKITSAQFTAQAKIGNKVYDSQRIEISYPHIPAQLLQPPARVKAVTLDLAIRGKRVGYVPGAGDSVAEALKQMGYEVTTLTGADLTTNRLKDFDAVIIGIRAFNVRNDLVSRLPDLFAFIEAGGNV